MKVLVVASKQDPAGMNIVEQLEQFKKIPLQTIEGSVMYTESLDMQEIEQYDFIIFASKHESQKKEKALTLHAPGNAKEAQFGGASGKLCSTSAQFMKQLFQELQKERDVSLLTHYQVTLEPTHHGPLIHKPCVFIEIGATQEEWKDPKAGFVIAKTILNTVENFKENPYHEIAVAIGGPHYCPNFNKVQLNANIAIGHIFPNYLFPLTEEILQQSIDTTKEDVDCFLLDWKGLGNAESKNQLLEIIHKMNIPYKRTDQLRKKFQEHQE